MAPFEIALSLVNPWRFPLHGLPLRCSVPLINNEEDCLYCTMIDAWRRGNAVGSVPMARHVMDIDYIDHSPDPRRHGATCPHSEGHVDGDHCTLVW
jgi:hypothetical protein